MGSRRARGPLAACLILAVCCHAGCSRTYHRLRADRDAYGLVQEKTHPHWPLSGYSIEIDPRSRMFDPFSVDCPPMPPDDPNSHRLMHCVDCKKGWPCWHACGDAPTVANPDWRGYLPQDENGVVTLDARRAVELAVLHSHDYQSQLEELYLSALDVSFERFRFDTQFFAGGALTYTADGPLRPGSGGESRSTLELSTFPASRGIRARRFFTTGGDLVVGLANSIVWQFAGPDSNDTTTLLDFSLIQPLLRAGGRARVMERLTLAERTLLANVRQMERYRRGFYVEIITGQDSGAGPSRRGGFFGGSGLEGFTGVGGGGFGRVGGFGGGNFGAGGFTGGAGAGQAEGFIGLLQAQQNIRNQEANIASLRSSVGQLEAFFRAGRIDFFQVELARQALYNAESQLLNSTAAYQRSLDDFKFSLGLAADVPLRIRDPLLDLFNLIDPDTVRLQNELTRVQQSVGESLLQLYPEQGPANAPPTEPPTAATVTSVRAQLQRRIQEAQFVRERLASQAVARARADIDKLEKSIPARIRAWERLRGWGDVRSVPEWDLLPRQSVQVEETLVSVPELRRLPQQLRTIVLELERRLQVHEQKLNEFVARLESLPELGPNADVATDDALEQFLKELPTALNLLADDALELALVQAQARTESVTLETIDIDWTTALDIAGEYRRDWMNARAALVDTWRLIEFNANDLRSQLDIVFSGDIRNVGDNPLDLRGATGRLRAGLQFDSPITRLSERNTYRQALIEYQQARRTYYRFVDRVAISLRGTLRSAEVNQWNFELRRAAVRVAISQVELARLRLQEPPQPNVELVFGATTARDLVTALSDLLNVQNDFLSVWVNHEVLRRTLDFNMGTMQLDPAGFWIDPGPITVDIAPTSAETVPPGRDEPADAEGPRELPPPDAEEMPDQALAEPPLLILRLPDAEREVVPVSFQPSSAP